MRILDLGCGYGRDLVSWGITTSDRVTGLDIDETRLAVAAAQFPNRLFSKGHGEHMPFESATFDRVISVVSLPYMNIQEAVAEIHRVLVPGGDLLLSLHRASFTVAELVHKALPKPLPTFFRLYVLANGVIFHYTGRTVPFVNHRTESFQTERGMKLVLGRAGFINLSFTRGRGPVGETFVVQASKAAAARPLAHAHAYAYAS